ncbi:DUF2187 family protein [Mesobacillus foraminis]|uniref:DUF2187 family protein n=1 Tax=Mesobacillus foraminis TaxID=279826 RepID=UPI001BEADE49|nr:DUF2187 family protein [Mesobacillus foraminis]MBT2756963.1 DUF2187 family protein [Mesobacillus foraminis]
MAADQAETKAESIKKADIGDMIEIKKGEEKGKKGKVVGIRENSVIVEIGRNPKKNEPIKTVVNHKNYKLAK